MTSGAEANERTIQLLFETVINGKQYGAIPQYCSPGVVIHRPGEAVTTGLDAYEAHYRGLHAAFPDFEATLTDVVSDETRVATRFSVTGTHRGELLGVEPTGTTVTFPAQVLFRLEDGIVVEEFHQSDRTSLREQLRASITDSGGCDS